MCMRSARRSRPRAPSPPGHPYLELVAELLADVVLRAAQVGGVLHRLAQPLMPQRPSAVSRCLGLTVSSCRMRSLALWAEDRGI